MDPVTGAVVLMGLQKFGAPAAELVKDFLSRVLGPIGDASGKALAHPIEDWHRRRVERATSTVADAVQMLADARQAPQEVPARILKPLLESASLEEEPELQLHWAALLANAASPTSSNRILPAYVEILRQLTPLEAQILEWVHSLREPMDGEDQWRTMKQVDVFARFPHLDVPGYLLLMEDLARLQLIHTSSALSLRDSIVIPTYDTFGFSRLCMHFMYACTPPKPHA